MFPARRFLANTVYFSDLLSGRFPELETNLQRLLNNSGCRIKTIHSTADIWCRDYMPVQVDKDEFVQFIYFPDYLSSPKYHHLITGPEAASGIPEIKTCVSSGIVLDGGNVVRWKNKIILTDKVFKENATMAQNKLIDALCNLLKIDKVIIIPTEPGDTIGHADGVVRFIDETSVAVNDYSGIDKDYCADLEQTLTDNNLDICRIPYRISYEQQDGIGSAIGNYVNFLQAKDCVIMPVYGIKEDEEAARTLSDLFPRVNFEILNCNELAAEGGVLNCISWNILQ